MPPHGPPGDESRAAARWGAVFGALVVLLIFVLVQNPPDRFLGGPSEDAPSDVAPEVSASPEAFGESRAVRLQLALPNEEFLFPLQVAGDPAALAYRWVRADDSAAVAPPAPLASARVRAPSVPGFFRLEIAEADAGRTILDSLLVGVMVPYGAKIGSSLNGYRIGNYRWERNAVDAPPPPRGFVEVTESSRTLAVSQHLQLEDFLTHDDQARWPRYVALDPRILDKVELVIALVALWRGKQDRDVQVDVHSGFRTPLHNRRVPRAALDSRHQFGDAADVAVDADGDGRITYRDAVTVGLAAEQIERDHPDLVGGIGVYGNFGGAPYVHLDVRGTRARWKR
ncbi:MAG: hypothetical protein K2X99_08335 [Gemmatimonadaceae bacterium]|nr:hypothetical protein [Gemmatimonadaceae bacterium]